MDSPSKLVHVRIPSSNAHDIAKVLALNAFKQCFHACHGNAIRVNALMGIAFNGHACSLGMKCKLSRVTVGINISLNIYITPHLVPSH
jgi:hypothetical protein